MITSQKRETLFDVDYYKTESGRCPVAEFIDALDNKMKAKVFGRIELLEKYGSQLNMPYSRHLNDGIFELRCVQGNNITRILYFFVVGKRVILTHGFVKKTQATPSLEIEKAKKIRADWEARNE